jgi:hypothetical protein
MILHQQHTAAELDVLDFLWTQPTTTTTTTTTKPMRKQRQRKESSQPKPDHPSTLPSLLQSQQRDLSALPGYYHSFVNRTRNPPKIYVYDALPAYQTCIQENRDAVEVYKMTYKHGGEVWFLEQTLSSPWRTHNKDEADLFVIPLLPGFVIYKKVCLDEAKQTMKWIKEQRKNQTTIATTTTNSRGGLMMRNHVLLSTHFVAEYPTIRDWCTMCIHLHQENTFDAPKRHPSHVVALSVPMFPQLYKAEPSSAHQSAPLTPILTKQLRDQTTDEFLANRPRAFYFAGQADDRPAYKGRKLVQQAWQQLNQRHGDNNFTFIITHTNPKYSKQKPTNKAVSSSTYTTPTFNFTHDVSTTRFGYQGRGDNPTSSRLYEWIDVGAIPVIVIDDAWLPGFHIPWNDFTIRIPERKLMTLSALEHEFERMAYEFSLDEMARMRAVLQEYAPALLWSAPESVVAEVMLIDAWEVYQAEQRKQKQQQQNQTTKIYSKITKREKAEIQGKVSSIRRLTSPSSSKSLLSIATKKVSQALNFTQETFLTCNVSSSLPVVLSNYTEGAVRTDFLDFVVVDEKPALWIDLHTNSSERQQQPYATCKHQPYRFSQHFPHFMQQLWRCWSFWRSLPDHQPLLLTPKYNPEIKPYKQEFQKAFEKEFTRGMWSLLPKLGVTIVNHSEQSMYQPSHVVDSKSISVKPTGPLQGEKDNAFQVANTEHMKALKHGVMKELGLITSNKTSSSCDSHLPNIAFLNRAGKTRHVFNANEIISDLQEYFHTNITLEQFEGKSFSEQVHLMSQWDIVITPHGAQETGLVFMRDCGGIIELMPRDYYYPKFFGTLAASAGIHHAVVHMTNNTSLEKHRWVKMRDEDIFCPSRNAMREALQLMINQWKACCAF